MCSLVTAAAPGAPVVSTDTDDNHGGRGLLVVLLPPPPPLLTGCALALVLGSCGLALAWDAHRW